MVRAAQMVDPAAHCFIVPAPHRTGDPKTRNQRHDTGPNFGMVVLFIGVERGEVYSL